MLQLQSLLGLALIVAVAFALSERRGAVRWRPVAVGIGLQATFALVLLKLDAVQAAFSRLNDVVSGLEAATRAGTAFVFGYIGGGAAPFEVSEPGASFVLGFQALPLILVISAISALLFHWNVIQPVVRGFAWALRRTLGIDGPAGVAVTMNIFVGMTEAPLVVRPYLRGVSRASLFAIMTAGMSTVAGTVMVLYSTILTGVIDNPLGQILTASLISAPAAIVMAFIMVPETSEQSGRDDVALMVAREPGDNVMSVITRGTLDGVPLMINVIAMLLVLVALVSLANQIIALLPNVGDAPLTLQRMFGWVMAPVAWAIGLPATEAVQGGALLGTKTVLNELIAYIEMSNLPDDALSPRSRLIMTYALCGFANFSSLGIMIGGLSAMVKERRQEIVALSTKSLISGTLATCMTGAVVGLITAP
ncbi:MAG: nucleoside:proton symporter [Alphaproteobacteria bacterium]|nr:nucleoside:proton symporter [Alphaproteobacteria bacterium]